jgi:hypothetical protein
MTDRAAVQMVAGAVRDAVAEQLDADERQLGLFGSPATEAGRVLLGDRVRRGPGRPPGSRNKRDEVTVRHLLQRYRDPRAVALERIQMHPADLAAWLGCTLAEADDKQRLWAAAVLPFLAARITPEVLHDNRQVVHLTINEAPVASAESAGAGAAATVLRDVEYCAIEATADDPSAKNGDNPNG